VPPSPFDAAVESSSRSVFLAGAEPRGSRAPSDPAVAHATGSSRRFTSGCLVTTSWSSRRPDSHAFGAPLAKRDSLRRTHPDVRSVQATGGVYKRQGLIRRGVLTRSHEAFLARGRGCPGLRPGPTSADRPDRFEDGRRHAAPCPRFDAPAASRAARVAPLRFREPSSTRRGSRGIRHCISRAARDISGHHRPVMDGTCRLRFAARLAIAVPHARSIADAEASLKRSRRGDESTPSLNTRTRSRSFTGSARQLAPRANNGHAPPLRPFFTPQGVRPDGLDGRDARRRHPKARASRSRRLDPVRSTALSRIEPQYPRLVVPLRQSLQVSLLRAYSPDGPVAEPPSCDPPGIPSLSVIGVSGSLC